MTDDKENSSTPKKSDLEVAGYQYGLGQPIRFEAFETPTSAPAQVDEHDFDRWLQPASASSDVAALKEMLARSDDENPVLGLLMGQTGAESKMADAKNASQRAGTPPTAQIPKAGDGPAKDTGEYAFRVEGKSESANQYFDQIDDRTPLPLKSEMEQANLKSATPGTPGTPGTAESQNELPWKNLEKKKKQPRKSLNDQLRLEIAKQSSHLRTNHDSSATSAVAYSDYSVRELEQSRVNAAKVASRSVLAFLILIGFVVFLAFVNTQGSNNAQHASDAFKRGEFQKAIVLYQKDLDSWSSNKPSNLLTHENIALARAQLGSYDEALAGLEVAIESRLQSRTNKIAGWTNIATDLANYCEIARVSNREAEIKKIQRQVWSSILNNSNSPDTRALNEYRLLSATASSLAWRGYSAESTALYKKIKEIKRDFPAKDRSVLYHALVDSTIPPPAKGLVLDTHLVR